MPSPSDAYKFYDPSKIGDAYKAAADKIQPVPVSDVASGISGPAPSIPDVQTQTAADPTGGWNPSDPFATPPPDTSGSPPGSPSNPYPDPTAPPTDPTAPPTDPTAGGAGGGTPTPTDPNSPGFWDSVLNGITGGQGIPGLGSAIGSAIPFAGVYAAAQNAAGKQQAANAKTVQPLMDQATKFLNEANTQLNLFSTGTLSPGQQAQIDAYAASQKSRVAQQMASQGITDSSASNSANQQIDNNAMIMKSNFVQQSLSNALSLEGAGMMPLMTAIQDKLISDNQITDTMMQLMGTLASAWAYQVAGNKAGGGGGGGSGSAAKGGVAGALINKGIDAAKGAVGKGIDSAINSFGTPTAGAAADAAGTAGLTDMSAAAAGNMAALPGMDMGITAGSLTPAADAAGTAAATDAGATSALGTGAAGVAGAAAIGAAPAILGASTAPYRLTPEYWNKLSSQLDSGKTGNATYDANTPPDQVQYNAKKSLYSMLLSQGGDTATIGGAKGNKIPQGFIDKAKQYGMINADGSINKSWNPGPDPFQAALWKKAGKDPLTGKPLGTVSTATSTGGRPH